MEVTFRDGYIFFSLDVLASDIEMLAAVGPSRVGRSDADCHPDQKQNTSDRNGFQAIEQIPFCCCWRCDALWQNKWIDIPVGSFQLKEEKQIINEWKYVYLDNYICYTCIFFLFSKMGQKEIEKILGNVIVLLLG